MDGQYFGVQDGHGNPGFGVVDHPTATLRIAPGGLGHLEVVSDIQNGALLGGSTSLNTGFVIGQQDFYDYTGWTIASCTRDTSTFALTCTLGQYNTSSVSGEVYDDRDYNLYWGLPDSNYVPVTLTYEPVTCPC